MLIPFKEETLLRVFRCPACGGVYRVAREGVRCTAIHSPGSCCHYGDAKLTEEQAEQLLKVVS